MNLALNNLQRLICHKTQPTNQPTNQHVFLMFEDNLKYKKHILKKNNELKANSLVDLFILKYIFN